MDWAQILVIILAIVLAIFLVMAIALVALLLKVTQQIKSITSTAERTAINIEKTVSGFRSVVSPLMVMRMVSKSIKKMKKRKG